MDNVSDSLYLRGRRFRSVAQEARQPSRSDGRLTCAALGSEARDARADETSSGLGSAAGFHPQQRRIRGIIRPRLLPHRRDTSSSAHALDQFPNVVARAPPIRPLGRLKLGDGSTEASDCRRSAFRIEQHAVARHRRVGAFTAVEAAGCPPSRPEFRKRLFYTDRARVRVSG